VISYTDIKKYFFEHWALITLAVVLVFVGGGILYYNHLQFSQRHLWLENIQAIPREEWAPPEIKPASPGWSYEGYLLVEPRVERFLRKEIPPIHRWGKSINVLKLKTPVITIKEAPPYEGPGQ